MLLVCVASPPFVISAQEPTRSPDDELSRVVRLFRADQPRLALEHLRRLQPELLADEGVATLARVLAEALNNGYQDHPALEALLSTTGEPRLRDHLLFHRARIRWLARNGRPGDALEASAEALRTFPDDTRTVLMDMIQSLRRARPALLAADPRVRADALRPMIDEVLRSHYTLYSDVEVLQSLARLEIHLDPDGPRAKMWADRAVRAGHGTPELLALRGDVEVARHRPDQALPWFLWSAYTTVNREESSPEAWHRLSTLYRRLGWRESSRLAYERGPRTSHWPAPSGARGNRSRVPGSCRRWHDWLIAYRPEKLTREWGGAWQSKVEDLRVWSQHCTLPPKTPFPETGGDCSGRRSGPARLALKMLQREADHHTLSTGGSSRRDRYAEKLICAVRMTVFLPDGWDDLLERLRTGADPPMRVVPDYWYVVGVVHLRRGEIDEALAAWQQALSLPPRARSRPLIFLDMLTDLTNVPTSRLEPRATVLGRSLQNWYQEHGESVVSIIQRAIVLRLAVLAQNLAPDTRVAERWSDEAVLRTRGDFAALLLRGRLEQLRGRPSQALPWFAWAERTEEGRYRRHQLPWVPTNGFSTTAIELGWWPRDGLARIELEPPGIGELEPGDALPRLLDDECIDQLRRVADLDVLRLIRVEEDDWWGASKRLAAWRNQCRPKR